MSVHSRFDQFPLEILLGIFRFLDISDILRMRKVSRYLNEVSRRRDVWAEAYHNADFVRPPGPFLSQSAHELENVLVPSFRLDRKLRHDGGASQSHNLMLELMEIRYTGKAVHVGLVFGRFLLIAFSNEVYCRDLNLDASHGKSCGSIIYRSTGGGLESFHCVSAVNVEGRQFACVVTKEPTQSEEGEQTRTSIYMLNVAEDFEVTLDLLHQFEHDEFRIRSVDLGSRVIVVQGRVGYAREWHVVALDVHARTQFILPSLIGAAWGTHEASEWPTMAPMRCISTSTHLFLSRSLDPGAAEPSTVFQAYALPSPNPHAHSTVLDYSHRGIIHGTILGTILVHDTILDPTTQDFLITIRMDALHPSGWFETRSEYVTLRLGRLLHDRLGTITFKPLASIGLDFRALFFRPSFNGVGRAFYWRESVILAALEYDVRGNGHSNGAPEVKVREYPSIIQFPGRRRVLDYDPYSGRICLEPYFTNDGVIEILDLVA